jgi:hypothetical protein
MKIVDVRASLSMMRAAGDGARFGENSHQNA